MKTNPTGLLPSLRSARSTAACTIAGTLDPGAPRTLLRLIQIGESAGLITPADQDAFVDAFGSAERRRESIDRALGRAPCSVTELYILVTLFAAEPRPVSLPTLARETLADSGALRFALERLEALAAISRELGAVGEPPIMLTSSGRGLAAILMYQVLRMAIAPRHDRDEAVETVQAKHRRSFLNTPAKPDASTLTVKQGTRYDTP